MFLTILVSILSGIGAGIGTGLAGLSAALIIAPALMTFCDMPAYEAVTIALASDVLASAISAWTYAKRKNLDVKNGVVLLLSILVFTLVGSYIGQFAPNTIVKYFAIFMVCTIGLKFIIWPVMTSKTEMANTPFAQRAIKSIFFGAIIGFICGFVGVTERRERFGCRPRNWLPPRDESTGGSWGTSSPPTCTRWSGG